MAEGSSSPRTNPSDYFSDEQPVIADKDPVEQGLTAQPGSMGVNVAHGGQTELCHLAEISGYSSRSP